MAIFQDVPFTHRKVSILVSKMKYTTMATCKSTHKLSYGVMELMWKSPELAVKDFLQSLWQKKIKKKKSQEQRSQELYHQFILAVTVLTGGQTFTMQKKAQPPTIHYGRNYLISLNLRMWPHQSLPLMILDLYIKLPPALWMTGICETLLSISAVTCIFLTSHLHQPHVQS